MRADVSKDQVISILENMISRYEKLAKIFEGSDWATYCTFMAKIDAVREAINKINYL